MMSRYATLTERSSNELHRLSGVLAWFLPPSNQAKNQNLLISPKED